MLPTQPLLKTILVLKFFRPNLPIVMENIIMYILLAYRKFTRKRTQVLQKQFRLMEQQSQKIRPVISALPAQGVRVNYWGKNEHYDRIEGRWQYKTFMSIKGRFKSTYFCKHRIVESYFQFWCLWIAGCRSTRGVEIDQFLDFTIITYFPYPL